MPVKSLDELLKIRENSKKKVNLRESGGGGEEVELLVLGEPRGLDGTEGENVDRVRRFGKKLLSSLKKVAEILDAPEHWVFRNPLRSKSAGVIGFAEKPQVRRSGKTATVSFAVRGPTDAAVSVVDNQGQLIGNGLVNYNARDIRAIMGIKSSQIKDRLGQKTYDEVIHRDNLVITGEKEQR